MAKTVVGLFDSFAEARNAVQDLVDIGITRDRISLVANDARGEFGSEREIGDSTAAEGAGAGAVGGTLAGGALGLLIGTGLLVIPGIGPVLAAGPLAAAIGTTAAAVGATALGAGIGAATGGLLGGLIGAGVPEAEAHTYTEGVRRGGTLVSVNADDDHAEQARDVLLRHGAVDIDRRSSEWRADGWEGGSSLRSPDLNDANDTATEDWRESSKAGTGTGTVAGAATGAAIGAAGGPIGAVIGGVAGAATGAAAGAAGDVAGERAEDNSDAFSHQRHAGDPTGISTPTSGTVGMAGAANPNYDRGSAQGDDFLRPDSATTRAGDDFLRPDNAGEGSDSTLEQGDFARGQREMSAPTSQPDFARGLDSTDSTRHSDFARGQHAGEPTGHPDFARGQRQFTDYDSDFRTHYQSSLPSGGRGYDDYTPGYRFGYDLASDTSYSGSSWSDVELSARERWERDNPNTWEQMKDSIRYAWEKARGHR